MYRYWHTVLLSERLERPLCYILTLFSLSNHLLKDCKTACCVNRFLNDSHLHGLKNSTSLHDYSPQKKTVMALHNGSLMLYLIWFIEEAKWLSCLWWCGGLWFIGVFMKQCVQFWRNYCNHYNNDPDPFSLDIQTFFGTLCPEQHLFFNCYSLWDMNK